MQILNRQNAIINKIYQHNKKKKKKKKLTIWSAIRSIHNYTSDIVVQQLDSYISTSYILLKAKQKEKPIDKFHTQCARNFCTFYDGDCFVLLEMINAYRIVCTYNSNTHITDRFIHRFFFPLLFSLVGRNLVCVKPLWPTFLLCFKMTTWVESPQRKKKHARGNADESLIVCREYDIL